MTPQTMKYLLDFFQKRAQGILFTEQICMLLQKKKTNNTTNVNTFLSLKSCEGHDTVRYTAVTLEYTAVEETEFDVNQLFK